MMITQPIFSIGIHKFYELELVELVNKIVHDNKSILLTSSDDHPIWTNFLGQSLTKHDVDENYVNLDDVKKLKQKILENAIEVLKLYGYYSEKTTYDVVNLWFNVTESMGYQDIHNHYGYILSGTFYSNVPQFSSPIRFHIPTDNFFPYNSPLGENIKYNQFNSASFTCYPSPGEMYFWLSSLKHDVPPIEFEGPRISCSFDISEKHKID